MSSELIVKPIGYVRTESRHKFDAPSQPDATRDETNFIDLVPGHQFDLALQDLDGFDRIWLIWWFHKNTSWRPRVLPPRGSAKRRGLFSTRSPHRPNPIGLTCVPLLAVSNGTLTVGPLDLIDGTPILDIKPYLRTVDSYPKSNLGWVQEIEDAKNLKPNFRVEIAAEAKDQLDWLRSQFNIDFTPRAFEILGQDPSAHRTRRILQLSSNYYRMACGPWRLYYRIEGDVVVVESVDKGYSDESLVAEYAADILDRDAQVAFAVWKAKPKIPTSE